MYVCMNEYMYVCMNEYMYIYIYMRSHRYDKYNFTLYIHFPLHDDFLECVYFIYL